MRKKLYHLSVATVLSLLISHSSTAQRLGALDGAEFYAKVTYADAPQLTRYAASINNANSYAVSMGMMVSPILELGASLAIESVSGVSGAGSLYGLYGYVYPLRQSEGSEFTWGIGAAFNGIQCSGSYGGCLDTQKGSEISFSSAASHTTVGRLLNVTSSLELGLTRSAWRLDSPALTGSGNTVYAYSVVGLSILFPGPTGTRFALNPEFLFSANDQQFALSIVFLAD